MRIVSTGSSATVTKPMRCNYNNTFTFPVALTEVFYTLTSTSARVIYAGLIHNAGGTAATFLTSAMTRNFFVVTPETYADHSKFWQPSIPITVYPGDQVVIGATAKDTSIGYMIGFNISM